MIKSIKISYKIILMVCAVLIFVLSLRHLPELHQLYVLHDEFGYWANAAYLAGYDWSGISTISPYYSYGYSMVIAPLYWIFKNPLVIYKAAICMNAVFYVCSFLVSYVCAKKLFANVNRYVLVCVCFVTALYCNNLMQSNMAWSEPFIYLLYWVSCLTFLCYLDKYRLKWLLIFAVELVFLYTIHQRALGVLAAGIVVVVFVAAVTRKISVRDLTLFACVIAGCLTLSVIGKGYLQDHLWVWTEEQTEIAIRNDYGGQFSKIWQILTSWDTFKDFIISVAGKFFYLFAASALLVYWGLKDAVVRGVQAIREKVPEKMCIWLYFVLSLLMALGVNAIFCTFMGRTDGYIYGRYMEYTVGPILLMGLISLYENREKIWSLLAGGVLLLATGFLVKKYLEMPGEYVYINSAGTSMFYEGSTQLFHTLDCIAVAGILAIFLFTASYFRKRWMQAAAVVPLVVFWFLAAEHALNQGPLYWQQYIQNVSQISETIEELDEGEEFPIYYIENPDAGPTAWRIEQVQFLLPDRRIQKIEYEDMEGLTGSYYLIHNGTEKMDLEKYLDVSQAYGMDVLVPADSSLGKRAEKYLGEQEYVFADTMMYCATSGEDHTFVSDHQEGFLVYRQDLTLTGGTYVIDMRLKVSEIEDDTIGYIDVCDKAGSEIISRQEVCALEYADGVTLCVEYPFTCETLHGAEIRFYAYGTAKVELESLGYRRE